MIRGKQVCTPGGKREEINTSDERDHDRGRL